MIVAVAGTSQNGNNNNKHLFALASSVIVTLAGTLQSVIVTLTGTSQNDNNNKHLYALQLTVL